MKVSKALLFIYCSLIGGVASLDLFVDPNHQPLKDIATVVAMSCSLVGIFKKKKELLLAIPIYALFFMASEAAVTKNIYFAIGESVGMLFPLAMFYFNYRSLSVEKKGSVKNDSLDANKNAP
jgi:hypothetical protein